jgi:HrpA-like RNA helicase
MLPDAAVAASTDLPIAAFAEKIKFHIATNQVTVIQGISMWICTLVYPMQITDRCLEQSVSGETGSGKSSRVPQLILSSWKEAEKASLRSKKAKPRPCFIIVTQPRRIAAVSLAKRVADELGQTVGEGSEVGYRIGNNSIFDPRSTRICFVTSGWLLQKLIATPSFIQRCTHLVLDEVFVS